MEKITAVQWLEDTLNKRLIHLSDEKTHIKHFVRTAKCAEVRKILETINQAKKMEKEQIEYAHVMGGDGEIEAEKYYKENYEQGE